MGRGSEAGGEGERIALLIEDDDADAMIVRRALRGWKVAHYHSFKEAYRAIDGSRPPDIIIADLYTTIGDDWEDYLQAMIAIAPVLTITSGPIASDAVVIGGIGAGLLPKRALVTIAAVVAHELARWARGPLRQAQGDQR